LLLRAGRSRERKPDLSCALIPGALEQGFMIACIQLLVFYVGLLAICYANQEY